MASGDAFSKGSPPENREKRSDRNPGEGLPRQAQDELAGRNGRICLGVFAGAGVREPALRLVSHERLRAAAGLPPRVLSLRVHVRHHPAVVAAAADLGQPLTGEPG